MAASISSSSSITQQTLLRYHNLSDHLINGVSFTPSVSVKKVSLFPIRCRFNIPYRNYSGYRTPEEFTAGHVPGAVNIPYMLRIGSGMTKNPNFLEQVLSQFSKDDEILVGCQSGKRSLMAANDLQSAGYTGIIDIAGGYSAWTQSELPTETVRNG
ncbi:thiosulfate sulfurtransferase 16, chloroplastic-like isoform X2 [Chenopodium quinoa]|uniref:thiosulfate sulfurtransferase 16, chloroplastic-like isoform X2 n=1 Tax=Chenopodium quinoa TaxID=63459 RepID=UPI000B77A7AD|nr:thiosulfate sulfurtransferase 16, chloroplastic-like isoform X2 [Chenopodium quinoa]